MSAGETRALTFSERRLAKAAFLLVASFAGIWAISNVPNAIRTTLLSDASSRIRNGEPFDDERLSRLIALGRVVETDAACRPQSLRSLAIIRLRSVETAMEHGDFAEADRRSNDLEASLRKLLSCAPHDAYGWFTLFWLRSGDGDLKAELPLLLMSYEMGPFEGWIAARRSQIALSVIDILPEKTQSLVVQEFVSLVNSGFLLEAAHIIAGPARHRSEMLLAKLADLPPGKKRRFAKAISRLGVEAEILLPDEESSASREASADEADEERPPEAMPESIEPASEVNGAGG